MEIAPGIIVDTDIKRGKPVIQGTRIPVALVLEKLAADTPFKEIIREYDLTRKQILNVFKYAAVVVTNEDVRPFNGQATFISAPDDDEPVPKKEDSEAKKAWEEHVNGSSVSHYDAAREIYGE